jgi:hypothetical protein
MRSKLIICILLGGLAYGGYEAWQQPAVTPFCSLVPEGPAREAARRIEPHLAWADEQNTQAIEDALATLDAFFDQARQGVPAFAESALSLSSKCRLMVDYLPGTSGDRHAEYLTAEFGRTIFTPEQLQQALERVVQHYMTELRSVESQMLLGMQVDLADLPPESLPPLLAPAGLEEHFQAALLEVQGAVSRELGGDVVCLTASTIGTSLATDLALMVLEQVGVRLGVSGGILTAGVDSGVATLGVGVVVGFIVDWVVGAVWDWFSDPRGQLQELLDRQLTRLQRLLIDGEGPEDGLRTKLQVLNQGRAVLRRATVTRLLNAKQE